ncbi:MAG: hypothetical protein B7Y86_09710 [Brevundimonas subvibrioides]|uniref:17 kDa surface antigen n=1 Tax=Brevundimonas subvibrioides TaxID=74313 RepID=A0A258HJC5_9CAUL|nr:MAG: hypothetical protein B7Y86_09710 [Brevundimonas subvibrioides]
MARSKRIQVGGAIDRLNKTSDLPGAAQGFSPMTAFVKSAAVAAALAAAATLVPGAASAQSYGYGNGYSQNQGYSQSYGYNDRNQDRCRTLGQGRTGSGALIGAGIGAIAGSQVAARGNRTEGSLIGGVLGAIVGAQVGRASNDQCRSNTTYSQAPTYYSSNDRYDDRAYSSNRYDDRGYRDDDRRDDRRDNRRDDRRYEGGYEVSADGHYYFDPRRGWLPR